MEGAEAEVAVEIDKITGATHHFDATIAFRFLGLYDSVLRGIDLFPMGLLAVSTLRLSYSGLVRPLSHASTTRSRFHGARVVSRFRFRVRPLSVFLHSK